MQRFLSLFFFFLLFQVYSTAQLIWTEPVFPTSNQAISVYFDAAKGTAGLKDCNCDIYVHTGLITSKSTSNSDWKYVFTEWGVANNDWKMQPVAGSPNVYRFDITPSIRELYGVTDAGEEIQKLAFVFRNANGSKEGKEVGGTDIFYNVYPENVALTATLITPSSSAIFTQVGATIPVEGAASQVATLSLYDNGELIYSAEGASLEYALNVTTTGVHLVEMIANIGATYDTVSFTYVAPGPNSVESLPAGAELGINYLSDTEVLLALYAPGKQNVFLLGDFNDWRLREKFQMKRTPDGATWWIQVSGLSPGKYYSFQYVVDGAIRIGDPYSQLILDPSADKWISESIFPNMPPYPENQTTGIVSLLQTGAPAFNWQHPNFERPDKSNLTIYELLMRDFLFQDYAKLTGWLDYFERMGVNAIELMPVNEFDGNNSWGYNPTYHHALDKVYGTPEAFKSFVDACHARGIAVILDVVFNHAHEKNPLCMLYWDDANFRPAADNPWLNQEATHDFSVFFDFNHEREATRAYVKKTLRHLLTEYQIDGFRFDLSKGFTQNVGAPFNAGAYDATRIGIIKEYMDEIKSVDSDAYIILEHFTDNNEERELSDYGAMFWAGAGVHNQYLEAAMGYSSNLSGVSYKSRGWNDPHLIAYMESHDEERMMYKNLQFGNSSGNYNVKNLSTALDRVELASAFFYTVPGPKMLWQFGELGYDYPINYCENGTENENCRTGPKPIPWSYTEDPDRLDVYNVVRSLLHLRNEYDVFQTSDFQLNVVGNQKSIRLNHASMNVNVLGNFAVNSANISPAFQHNGWWYDYFSGDSINVTDVNAAISLQAGEYRLYTDVRVQKPGFVTNNREIAPFKPNWSVFPNPSDGNFRLLLKMDRSTPLELALFDAQGRKLKLLAKENFPGGALELNIQETLNPGVYFIRLVANGVVDTKKLLVVEDRW